MPAREVVGQIARDRDAVVGDLRPVGEDDDACRGCRSRRSRCRPGVVEAHADLGLAFAHRDDRGVVAAREERLDAGLGVDARPGRRSSPGRCSPTPSPARRTRPVVPGAMSASASRPMGPSGVSSRPRAVPLQFRTATSASSRRACSRPGSSAQYVAGVGREELRVVRAAAVARRSAG